MPAVPALRRLRQKGFQSSTGCFVGSSWKRKGREKGKEEEEGTEKQKDLPGRPLYLDTFGKSST